jgi:hypothetical protein
MSIVCNTVPKSSTAEHAPTRGIDKNAGSADAEPAFPST